MQTKIKLEAVKIHSFIGYYEEERLAGTHFIIDTEVSLSDGFVNREDIDDTVNYEHLFTICNEEMKKSHLMIETAARNILETYTARFKNMATAMIRIKKVGPQLGGNVGFAVIEMSTD